MYGPVIPASRHHSRSTGALYAPDVYGASGEGWVHFHYHLCIHLRFLSFSVSIELYIYVFKSVCFYLNLICWIISHLWFFLIFPQVTFSLSTTLFGHFSHWQVTFLCVCVYNLSYVMFKYGIFLCSQLCTSSLYMFWEKKKKNQNGGWSVLIVNDGVESS